MAGGVSALYRAAGENVLRMRARGGGPRAVAVDAGNERSSLRAFGAVWRKSRELLFRRGEAPGCPDARGLRECTGRALAGAAG